MVLDDGPHRRALDLAFGEQPGEDGRLQNSKPDVEPDADQHEA